MTTSGTYYYPPSAGTGNLLLSNPPFIFQSMDTNQPTPADDLRDRKLTEAEFQQLSRDAGGASRFDACNYNHALRIAQLAFTAGADVELEACCAWLDDTIVVSPHCQAKRLRAARRPKPPSLRQQALAAARIELDANGKNGALIIRALEALPD